MRTKNIEKLAKNRKYFKIDEVRKILNVSPNALKLILFRLEKAGRIERIEKGKYIIIPLGNEKGKYTLHEFVIASKLIKNYSIAYWSALNYYGFTEQIPTTVFVQTTERKKKTSLQVFGVKYRFVRIKKEKMFGLTHEWIEEEKIMITDREKTIIDCLDRPDLCGGIIEAAKAIKGKEYDVVKLAKYAGLIGNSAVVRRLGYLCGLYSVNIGMEPEKTRNYVKLDPAMPLHRDKVDSKWKLYLNVDEKELGKLE